MDHFDMLAPWYDRLIHPPSDGRLALLLEADGQGLLLDAAGGTGRIAQSLAAGNCPIIVADGSLRMVRGARGKPGLLAVGALAEQLPFADGVFSRVIMVDALHHVADQPATLAELWRMVAPAGRLIIEEPDIRQPAVKLIALAEKLALMRSHFVSAEWIADQLSPMSPDIRMLREGNTCWVVARRDGPPS